MHGKPCKHEAGSIRIKKEKKHLHTRFYFSMKGYTQDGKI